MERHVPELHDWVRNNNEAAPVMRCAILDVVSWFPGVQHHLWKDVSVRCPHAERYNESASKREVAAVAGGVEKTNRYGTAVRSLVFETYGLRCSHTPGCNPVQLSLLTYASRSLDCTTGRQGHNLYLQRSPTYCVECSKSAVRLKEGGERRRSTATRQKSRGQHHHPNRRRRGKHCRTTGGRESNTSPQKEGESINHKER